MPLEQVRLNEAVDKSEFHSLLRDWLNSADDSTIGDADFGKSAWLHVRDAAARYRLNADTTRQGVAEYLQLVERYGDGLKWSVVANRDGVENAVAYGPESRRVRRFYLYFVQ
jgi:hypothetical protein